MNLEEEAENLLRILAERKKEIKESMANCSIGQLKLVIETAKELLELKFKEHEG